jgi:N-acetylated-alpha-linked acidic dipeptidase
MSLPRALPLLTVGLALASPGRAEAPPPLGFAAEGWKRQSTLETRFDAALDPALLRDWMRRLSARPHPVGSPYGREVAEFLAARFREWGYDTAIEEFSVLFPTPRTRLVELIAPESYRARLAEPALREDRTSGQRAEQLPLYNAYSVDGDVSGELVYVNYGVPEDYEELERRGIDVRGRIVIARYGGSWRGIKPKVAAEKGALGCLIYSDPRDDGFFEGDAYPKGAFRGQWGAQRGSVADMPRHPGDPLTPGRGATPDAVRLQRSEAATLTKIPVLPLPWGDALPLLRHLGGPVAPEGWRGALPLTYHLGPGPARVRLKAEFDWRLVPARNVIARLGGSEHPDEWILRGNHHDAWVNGAHDPVSGLVALMAEARALGELAKGGWRPRRTLVYAAWDGEEPGLLGSTEWAETHAAELEARTIAYVNSDSNGRGFLFAGGSPSLERLVESVAREVEDPQRGVSVAERQRARRLVHGSADEKKRAREDAGLRLDPLGSGSDYTPFLQHLGIASVNLGFGGEGRGGSYHSIYDSFDHYTRFIDPELAYGVTLARVAGRVVLRLAEADVPPFEFTALGETVARYLGELKQLAARLRAEAEEHNRLLREGSLLAAADPGEPFVLPAPRPAVPHLNLAPLENSVARLREACSRYAESLAARGDRMLDTDARGGLGALLLGVERTLLAEEGLPDRPWFRHTLYAPGSYTGYGVKTLPGVREAIEGQRYALAERQAALAASRLEAAAARIESAAELLRAAR